MRDELNLHLPEPVLIPILSFGGAWEQRLAPLEIVFRVHPVGMSVMVPKHLPLCHAENPESHRAAVIIILIRDHCFQGIPRRLRIPFAPMTYGSTTEQDFRFLTRVIGRVSYTSKPFQDLFNTGIILSGSAGGSNAPTNFVIQKGTSVDCIQPSQDFIDVWHTGDSFYFFPPRSTCTERSGALIS